MGKKKLITYAVVAAMTLSCIVPENGFAQAAEADVKVESQLPSSYSTGFRIEKDTIYNESTSKCVQLLGHLRDSHDLGLNAIYYQGEKLEEGQDFNVNENVLRFSEAFSKALPEGLNEFTVYANYDQDNTNGSSVITVNKVNYEIPNTYVSEYPLAETSVFHTTMDVCENGLSSGYLTYGLSSMQSFDKVYIDHKLISQIAVSDVPTGLRQYYSQRCGNDGEGLFYLEESLFHDMVSGVHYIEVVRDGESEVLTVILYDKDKSTVELMEEAANPESSEGKLDRKTSFCINPISVYEENMADTLFIKGNYWGLSYIYFMGRKLTEDVDYEIFNNYLKFSDDILEQLHTGNNKFMVYAKQSELSNNTSYTVNVYKASDSFSGSYIPKYPLKEESNFYTSFDTCSLSDFRWSIASFGMKTYIPYKEVYLDHQRVSYVEPSDVPTGIRDYFNVPSGFNGGAFFCMYDNAFEKLEPGIHYIEVVEDGESEVLTVLLYDDTATPVTVLQRQNTPVSKIKVKAEVSSEAGTGISQRYTIRQTDSSETLDLKKLKIRYYYTKSGNAQQSFVCDNAGITLGKAPYYLDYTDEVRGIFGEDYVEITFDEHYNLANNPLQFAVRLYQNDWSKYEGLEENAMEVYYDGTLAYQEKFVE